MNVCDQCREPLDLGRFGTVNVDINLGQGSHSYQEFHSVQCTAAWLAAYLERVAAAR